MSDDDWEAVTWEGARRARVRDQARLAPEQRLRWLEEAMRLSAATADRRGTRSRHAASSAPRARRDEG